METPTELMKNLSSLVTLNSKLLKHKITYLPYTNLYGPIQDDGLMSNYKRVKAFKKNLSEVNLLKGNRKAFEREVRHHRKLTTENAKLKRHREKLNSAIVKFLAEHQYSDISQVT